MKIWHVQNAIDVFMHHSVRLVHEQVFQCIVQRRMLQRRIFNTAQKMMPRISTTERIALRSGTKGIEQFVFDGTLSNAIMRRELTEPELNAADKKMLTKLPKLLETIDEYAIMQSRRTPKDHPFWENAKREGFFGLIVPDAYGGNEMSKTGLSKLLQRVASVSTSASVHIMVPASLGPAELLSHYGTEAQKRKYLPKLAKEPFRALA